MIHRTLTLTALFIIILMALCFYAVFVFPYLRLLQRARAASR